MAEPPRSPGSTIAASEFDDHMTHASSPIRADPRTSLQHVLGHIDSPHNTPSAARHSDMTEDEGEVRTPGPGAEAPSTAASRRRKDTAATATTKDNPIYLGNKVRHLKKDDGEPLWRKDIQYDFLKYVFENDQAVFTNSYEPDTIGKQTFADLYIDTMARSSKTSKILRDKLLTEHEPARNMAMVCLLVNLGRMNTTLNCMYGTLDLSQLADFIQSFQRCAHSSELTMPFPPYRHVKIRTPTSSFKMLPALSPFSRELLRTDQSLLRWRRSRSKLSLEPTLSIWFSYLPSLHPR